jgi:hypothetical protein
MDDGTTLSSDLRDQMDELREGATADGTLAVTPREGYVADAITLRGRHLDPGRTYELVWHTTEGQWGVLKAHEVVGPQYRPRTETIAAVETDEDGSFETEWTVPEDYGGSHRIELLDGEATVDHAEFDLRPWFEIDRTTAPLGEAFTVTGYGIGPDMSTNNYQITWDMGYVGFMTGVQNRGTATARVRAVGPPGEHVLQVWRSYRGRPFVQNNTQSPLGPVADGRQSVWTVEVTEPETPPTTAWTDPLLEEGPLPVHYPNLDADTGATLDVSPQCGPAGTTVTITGREFPANAEVDLRWYQHVAEGIMSVEVDLEPRAGVLPTVETDADGRFEAEVEVPPAEGGTRPIVAAVDGREVAVSGFMMQPSIVNFEPTSGPVGTEITIELSGIGWTTYGSSPFFVYDNTVVGYACGMTDEDGSPTVETVFRAAGEPGYHFIDVYPSLFKVKDDVPEFEALPHLSYLDNHPVRPLPACHMAFEVTG